MMLFKRCILSLNLFLFTAPNLLASDCKHTEIVAKISRKSMKEVSGLALSRTYPRVFWGHNDAGDGARFIAFHLNGQRLGRFKLDGATNRDYEDMSFGPCLKSEGDCLYIGDIGNNELNRTDLTIYEVPEPNPFSKEAQKKGHVKLKNWKKHIFDLKEPHNSEALIFHKFASKFYLFTKSHRLTWEKYPQNKGKSFIFELDPKEKKVKKIGHLNTFQFKRNRKKAKLKPRSSFVTGAAVSPKGDKFILSTLKHGIEYKLNKGKDPFNPFSQNYSNKYRFPRFVGAQIEAITYDQDGKSIYILSESTLKKNKYLRLFKVNCQKGISLKHMQFKVWEFFN
tara:strand:+ start:480 stop:1493 length:1014 start_codon:yes stop_codon:yes gene_type:complete